MRLVNLDDLGRVHSNSLRVCVVVDSWLETLGFPGDHGLDTLTALDGDTFYIYRDPMARDTHYSKLCPGVLDCHEADVRVHSEGLPDTLVRLTVLGVVVEDTEDTYVIVRAVVSLGAVVRLGDDYHSLELLLRVACGRESLPLLRAMVAAVTVSMAAVVATVSSSREFGLEAYSGLLGFVEAYLLIVGALVADD